MHHRAVRAMGRQSGWVPAMCAAPLPAGSGQLALGRGRALASVLENFKVRPADDDELLQAGWVAAVSE